MGPGFDPVSVSGSRALPCAPSFSLDRLEQSDLTYLQESEKDRQGVSLGLDVALGHFCLRAPTQSKSDEGQSSKACPAGRQYHQKARVGALLIITNNNSYLLASQSSALGRGLFAPPSHESGRGGPESLEEPEPGTPPHPHPWLWFPLHKRIWWVRCSRNTCQL